MPSNEIPVNADFRLMIYAVTDEGKSVPIQHLRFHFEGMAECHLAFEVISARHGNVIPLLTVDGILPRAREIDLRPGWRIGIHCSVRAGARRLNVLIKFYLGETCGGRKYTQQRGEEKTTQCQLDRDSSMPINKENK